MSSSSTPLLPGCYAIFKFKRYEDSSLSYTGLYKHENEDVGGWDTVVKRKEYELLFYNQQSTMNAPEIGRGAGAAQSPRSNSDTTG